MSVRSAMEQAQEILEKDAASSLNPNDICDELRIRLNVLTTSEISYTESEEW